MGSAGTVRAKSVRVLGHQSNSDLATVSISALT